MIPSRRSILRLAGIAAALLGLGGTALAQSAACQQYRAELASLPRSGNSQAAAAAQRQQAELARMSAYYRSIGCDRGFSFFGSAAPPECGAIAQRIQAMQGNLARLGAQADPYAGQIEARRRQLTALAEQACDPQRQAAVAPQQPRGFFEQLFGGPARPQQQQAPAEMRQGLPLEGEEGEARPRLGGRKLVCVKTCDGSFFPLANMPEGREGADAMCQALCPGAPTQAFYTGDGPIENALSTQGKPYTGLPAASKFRKTFDPSCSCRGEGQSWAQTLAKAEEMLGSRRGDLVVTAAKAEELSRPRAEPAPRNAARREAKAPPPPAPAAPAARAPDVEDESRVEAQRAAQAPTAGTESAGIGPLIEDAPVVGRSEGGRRDVTTDTGARRTVRTVAPNPSAVPLGPSVR